MIKIGYPKNSQLRKDLAPVEEALELKSDGRGNLTSPLLQNAIFRELRAQDIATLLGENNLNMGFLGADVMTEYNLRYQATTITQKISSDIRLMLGQVADMCLLVPENDRAAFDNAPEEYEIVTSYPYITKEKIGEVIRIAREKISLLKVAGQTENIVANGDRPKIVAVDIVRSGKTAENYNLVPYGPPLISSRPVLAYTCDSQKNPEYGKTYLELAELLNKNNIPYIIPYYDEDPTFERNDILKRLSTQRRNGTKILDTSTLSIEETEKIGRIAMENPTTCLFRTKEAIESTMLDRSKKDTLLEILERESSQESQELGRIMGTAKFSKWLGIDLSKPAAIIELESEKQRRNREKAMRLLMPNLRKGH